MKRDNDIEAVVWALGTVSAVLAIAAGLSIWLQVW